MVSKWMDTLDQNIQSVISTLRTELTGQGVDNTKFEDIKGQENLYYFLLSSYLYLHDTKQCVDQEIFFNYLMEVLKYIFYVQTMDFHLVNTAQLKYDHGNTLPYLVCSRICYRNTNDKEILASYLVAVSHLRDYSKLLLTLEMCSKNI